MTSTPRCQTKRTFHKVNSFKLKFTHIEINIISYNKNNGNKFTISQVVWGLQGFLWDHCRIIILAKAYTYYHTWDWQFKEYMKKMSIVTNPIPVHIHGAQQCALTSPGEIEMIHFKKNMPFYPIMKQRLQFQSNISILHTACPYNHKFLAGDMQQERAQIENHCSPIATCRAVLLQLNL